MVYLVEHSKEGYFASELQTLLEVRVHNALAHLYVAKLVGREQHANQYVYVSPTEGVSQLKNRYEAIQQSHEQESATIEETSDEIRESMRLLLSVLNEKQRRLYLGIESMRLGHGGDVKISRITGANVKTIALGRRSLPAGKVNGQPFREVGGGRPPG